MECLEYRAIGTRFIPISTMQLPTNFHLSERFLSVTQSWLSCLRRHVANESRLSALPDEESQGTASALPDYNSSCLANISVMKAAQHVSDVPYVVKSVAATVMSRLLYFEMRTTRHRVSMFAVALPQAA